MSLSADRVEALETGNFVVTLEGYETLALPISSLVNLDSSSSATSGLNFAMQALTSPVGIYYSEGFDFAGAGVCGDWTEVTPEFPDLPEIPFELPEDCIDCLTPPDGLTQPGDQNTLWNLRTATTSIFNQAYLDGHVVLAPGDSSAGRIPVPATDEGACWYGGSTIGTSETGNFLGAKSSDSSDLDGGLSETHNSGSIISPMIDLTGVTAPLSITFDSWWEIESVNPNELGFDIMSLEVSTDSGSSWETLAKLNPFSDPVDSGVERAPIPFSNRGYNKAPAWLSQEPISLDDYAGSQVQLRFTFRTQDELYNGFRGWLIDNVRITDQLGTFPPYVEPEYPDGPFEPEEPVEPEVPVEPEEPADFTVSLDLSPNPNFSLNDGSTYNFAADLSWAGGNVSVGSARLDVTIGTDTISDNVTDLTEKSVTLSAPAQVSGGTTVYVTVMLFDEGGNEVYSEVTTYFVMFI